MRKTDDMMEIDLKKMIAVLWAKAWLIAICGVVLAIGAFCYSKFLMKPMYCSTAKIYVMTQSANQVPVYSDVVMSTYLSEDYAYLVKSNDVLEKVIKECNLKDNYNSLAGRITVERLMDTRILSIAVRDTDPAMAQKIANKVCENSAVHLKNVMNLEAVNIAEKANMPTSQASPNVQKWTALGMLAGMIICAGIIVLLFLLDDTIKTREDIEYYLELSTLALIPITEEEKPEKKKRKETEATQEETSADGNKEEPTADAAKTEPESQGVKEKKEDEAAAKEETTKEKVEKATKKEEA